MHKLTIPFIVFGGFFILVTSVFTFSNIFSNTTEQKKRLSLQRQNLEKTMPKTFVYLTDIVPDVILEMRYYSTYNFVGNRIDSYHLPLAIVTKDAAMQVKKVNQEMREKGYTLKIFDAYRPQSAVNHFVRWAKDIQDVKTKDIFYPHVDKADLFTKGYITNHSGHSRGSTLDLTLVELQTGKEVDMGGAFDFFGEVSHHGTNLITSKQAENRLMLKQTMEKHGFKPYQKEWWHYTLANEPYLDTYFDFAVDLYK
ncbi:M15 family metallopeptidase [Bacillus cereus group sp. BfR-BA-01349]|uniref:M15 family metallopeptidase n=1 Tax=Bacillus cereus group sp. BfR-BA-01349 TaxID=2920312 RepID=UPI001F5ACDC4